jgi:transposase
MLNLSGGLKVFVALDPIDMRKGFEGLCGAVDQRIMGDVKSGAFFVFSNRSRNRLKILYWDRTGLWVMTKRLEQGRFTWPRAEDASKATCISLDPTAFAMLVDGIDIHKASMKRWYQRP